MKTTATADDGELHQQGPVPYALPLDHDGPRALDVMQIDEDAGWLLDLLAFPLEPHGGGDDDDATTSLSTITAETCITGDEMMLPTEGEDWDSWLLQAQDSAANPRGDDDATTTSAAAADMAADGGRWEMHIDKGDDGEWVLRFDDWVPHPHGDDAATAATAESRVTGDDHWQPGAGDGGAAGDLPLDWWVPEPMDPTDQLAQGEGVLPDLEVAFSLDLC